MLLKAVACAIAVSFPVCLSTSSMMAGRPEARFARALFHQALSMVKEPGGGEGTSPMSRLERFKNDF